MNTSHKEFDAIIVGSGPGGATVAKNLSKNGKKVLILERGANNPVKGTFRQFVKGCFIPGKSLLVTSQLLGMVRGLTTGGSSIYYCGTAFNPAVDMLKTHHVDISKEAVEIKNEIPIAPLADNLMSPAANRFMEGAIDLGYDCHKLDKFIYQDKCRTGCQLCDYGCPYDAKWNARFFVNEALENNAELITGAMVQKVLIEKDKAIGVEYKHKQKRHSVFAQKIILSAGGIGSPMILRQSGIPDVGYDFFFDPLWIVSGKVKGLNEGRGIPMSAGFHMKEDGIMMTDFNMPHILKILFDLEVFKFHKAISYKNILPIMVKVKDELGGRITKHGLISKKLTDNDKKKLNKGAEHAKRILEHLGATGIYKSWLLAAHPGGTVKIGEHLNENLKTRFENLYVCDCSVIPEEMGMPPTWMILSLAKRLSKHLLGVRQVSGKKDPVEAVVVESGQDIPQKVEKVA